MFFNTQMKPRTAKLSVTLGVALAACLLTQGAGAAASSSPMALNLSGMLTYAPFIPVIDQMKKSGNWLTQCDSWNTGCSGFASGASSWNTNEQAKLDVDENGWIRSLPAANDTKAKYRRVTTALYEGSVHQQVGKYVVLYDGVGTITYSGTVSKIAAESKPGRDVISVTAGSSGVFLSVTAVTPSNYLRNIRVLPPGGACENDLDVYAKDASVCTAQTGKFVPFESFENTNRWHPAFLADLKGFRTLRFMDWANTNTTTLAHWADRPLPTDRTWAGDNGMPLERQFALARRVGADPWVNFSPYVDDDYALQFAKLAKEKLGPNATLNLEYANEPWNYGFSATLWMYNKAKALWAKEAANGANTFLLQTNWYALRSAQLCRIVKAEFGADASRVRCIANSQAGNAWIGDQMMQCTYAAKILGMPCNKIFDVLSIAPYFAGYVGETKFRSTIANWYKDADGGLAKLFTEITGTDANGKLITPPLAGLGSGRPGGSLADTQSMVRANKVVADSHGLPLWAYEGGQHLVVYGTDNDQNFLNLLYAANRDPRMGQAYNKMLEIWKANGGETYALFSHTSSYSRWGMWGLKEDQFKTSPKWEMAVKWRDTVACWWAGCEKN